LHTPVLPAAPGGDVFRRSFECLAPFGRMVNYGNASGQPTVLDT